MNGITELALKLKNQENFPPYTPIFGEIISLPELQIKCGDKTILDKDDISAVFDIYEKVVYEYSTEYVNLNKTVVLLPCYDKKGNANKFVAIGVVQ